MFKKMKFINMSHKMKMLRLRITVEKILQTTTNFLNMKRWEISGTLTVASWTWGTLAMEMEFSWKNWTSALTGNSMVDA